MGFRWLQGRVVVEVLARWLNPALRFGAWS
jgi:hypothetical protein